MMHQSISDAIKIEQCEELDRDNVKNSVIIVIVIVSSL